MFLKPQRIQNTAIIFFALCIGYGSCTTNDKQDPADTQAETPVAVITDTAVSLTDSLARIDNTVVKDTTIGTVTARPAGAAKPNPAKKGMKGKVVVNAPAKATGSMEADTKGVYSNVEYLPAFPGGSKGLQTYFDKNMKYPEDASAEGVEGVVNVSFIVDETGKLTVVRTEGEKLGYGLEEEAIRVVRAMPTWTPGRLKGNNVKTKYTLPVRFELY